MSKFLFGDTSKESIIEIPQGELYLVRPLSPKGYSELIFKDAAATIRRTGQDFQYQLVIQRAFEEGEEELADDEDEQGAADNLDKDEKVFLLDQSLHFRSELREGGIKILAWDDLSGDEGDLFEFVCDPSVPSDKVATFELAALQCQYERKFRRSAQQATEEELQEFSHQEEKPLPSASPVASPTLKSQESLPTSGDSAAAMARDVKYAQSKGQVKSAVPDEEPTSAPPSAAQPEVKEVLTKERTELHLFDFTTGTFVLQDSEVIASVSEVGAWQYWLQISGNEKEWLGQAVVGDINPVFNFEYLSFIFNHYAEDGSAYSWLLRFKDQPSEERFQEGLMQALWEQLNEMKWNKVKENDREYVLDAFQDLTMEDADDKPEEEEPEEEEEETDQDDGQRSEHYDSDEEEEDLVTRDKDGNVNSQLAVGYKHDRSFVVRGSKIGVFKHTPNNNLEFSTTISKVETPNGKLFSPKKVMLHAEDQNLILQNQDDPNSLFRMDLEYGKVVDEWKVHDDISVDTFAPENVSLASLLHLIDCITNECGRNSPN